MNLGSETVKKLGNYGYNVQDIEWIGNRDFTIPIHEFFEVARHTNYNNGYGIANIPRDLIIVLKDGCWFSRGEYDGSEWWEYNVPPHRPYHRKHLMVKNFLEPEYALDPILEEACGIIKEF